jgi:excisionase family DNA binding protein
MSTKMLYRINEAAAALGRSRSRIYESITDGELEVVKDGRSALITADSLHAFIESLRAQAHGPPGGAITQGRGGGGGGGGERPAVSLGQGKGRAAHPVEKS